MSGPNSAPLLVTGCAGFIGFHLCRRLLQSGHAVVGVDNLNDYYSVSLKEERLEILQALGLNFHRLDLSHIQTCPRLFESFGFRRVIHLAAQAGVRYAKVNPHAYTASNIEGFLNVLEACKKAEVEHLIYASSSSVYGANQKLPYSIQDRTDHPVSLYGATKKANEAMAHSYSWMYGLPTTGLRFFTVYGPWGRPDMALYTFADAIMAERPVHLYNHGKMMRDFTYVDDVVETLVRLLALPPVAKENTAPYQIFNVGNSSPVDLRAFLELIESMLGKKAQVELHPLQAGDVLETSADTLELENHVGFRPATPLQKGIQNCIEWYLTHRQKSKV